MILEEDAGVRVLRASGTLFYGRNGIAQGFQGRRLWRTRVLPCGDFSGLSEQGWAKLRGQPPGSLSQHRQEETTAPATEAAVECRGSALQGTQSSKTF